MIIPQEKIAERVPPGSYFFVTYGRDERACFALWVRSDMTRAYARVVSSERVDGPKIHPEVFDGRVNWIETLKAVVVSDDEASAMIMAARHFTGHDQWIRFAARQWERLTS